MANQPIMVLLRVAAAAHVITYVQPRNAVMDPCAYLITSNAITI